MPAANGKGSSPSHSGNGAQASSSASNDYAPGSMYRGWRWEDLRLVRAFDGGPEVRQDHGLVIYSPSPGGAHHLFLECVTP